jgi:FkbM family methyltransferase
MAPISRGTPAAGYCVEMTTIAHTDAAFDHALGLKYALLTQVARVTRRAQPKGTDRLLRAIYNPDRRAADWFATVLPYAEHSRIHCDSRSFIDWRIFFYGRYKSETADVIRRYARAGDAVIDVGAHAGCHTLLLAEAVGPAGQVIAIEPHPGTFRQLIANIALNDRRAILPLQCAASDRDGQMELYVDDAEALQAVGAAAAFVGQGDRRAGTPIPIDVRRIDTIMAPHVSRGVGFIKIEAQGHELPVLLGATDTIAAHRPVVLFKHITSLWASNGHEFARAGAFFADRGYALFSVRRDGIHAASDGARPSEGDYLAVPNGFEALVPHDQRLTTDP